MLIISEEHLQIEKYIPAQVIEIRKYLLEKHGIEVPVHCEEFIKRCLRQKDGNLDKAVKLILGIRTTIVNFDQWNVKMQPSLYAEMFNNGGLIVLKHRDSFNRRIFLTRMEHWNPDNFSFDEWIMAVYMQAQFANGEDVEMQRHGYVVIIDFANFTMRQFWAIKQLRLLYFVRWVQNGVNGRLKGFHGINQPTVVKFLYSGVQPFLSQKIKKRVHFHSTLSHLHEHVSPSILPTYLGGQLDPEDCADLEFYRKLISSDAFFEDMVINGLPIK